MKRLRIKSLENEYLPKRNQRDVTRFEYKSISYGHVNNHEPKEIDGWDKDAIKGYVG